ncbi:MAG: hypothetical protein HYY76_09325 [Acidobacteria bacterium]|nr:hypothetical protein [Acidobacteriota bacterium]
MASTELSFRIRRQLSRYLAGQMSFHQFTAWLSPITLATFESGDPQTQDLVAEMELRFAEYSNGDWTEEALRNLLRPLVVTYTSSLAPREEYLVSGSASTIRLSSLSYSVTISGTGRARVSG